MKKEEIKDLPPIVQKYLSYQLGIRNRSQLTVLEYASDLRSFVRFLTLDDKSKYDEESFDKIEIKDVPAELILNATLQDGIDFIAFCNTERSNNPNTRSRKASSLRSFYKWITHKEELIKDNPMEYLESPKLKKSLPKYLTLNESINLLDCIDGPFKERDYCIITFFLNCGLRLSELVSLNYNDIRDDRTMTVTGKGNKERTIYLNDACVNAYKQYMKVRPVEGVKDKNALFLSRLKKRISPKTVQHIVYTLLEKAGLDGKGLSTHKLRHTAATLMYQYGDVDVMLIKEVLGHENLSTTEIYTHISDKQLKNAVDSNPLSGVKQTDNSSGSSEAEQ